MANKAANFMGGAHAFADLPNPWRRFDSSAAAPCLHPPFLSNKIETFLVISLSVLSAASMVAEASSIGGDFRAKAGGALCTGGLAHSGRPPAGLPFTKLLRILSPERILPARSSTEAPQAQHGRTLPRLLHCPDLWSVVSSRRRRPDFVILSFACVSMLIGDEMLTTSAVDAGKDSGYHLLVVKDYSRAVREAPNGEEISSGDFIVGGHKWCICYCPNGADPSCADFISLFFDRCCDDDDIEEPVEAKVEFSFVDQVEYQKLMHIRASKTYSFSSKSPSRGFPEFVRRDILERSGNLKGDCFTIRCDIMGCKDLNSQDAGSTVSDIHQHFDNLLQNKVGTDVTFEVSGETFAAHRCVLAARSMVFMAQVFGHMSEGTTSSAIQIKDMRAKVFAALLRFIYTDSFPEIGKNNYLEGGKAEVVEPGQEEEVDYAMWVQDLFVVAGRYDLQRLKLLCEELLSEHVGVSSVASTLALAEQHYCRGLKKACLKFIQVQSPKCLDKIMATDGWEHITTTYPSVLNELIAKLASNQKDKKRKHERM